MKYCSNCGESLAATTQFCPACGTKRVDADEQGDPLLGRMLNDKYRILEPIGAGSMGTVYLAEHIGLNKTVALKVLRTDLEVDQELLRRFQREGIAAGRFNHPNAIQIFDFDQSDKIFYLAMEYVEGRNLSEFMQQEKQVSLATAIDLSRQILEALAAAHAQGIVHRDLKPDNVMLIEHEDASATVKVLDFGLSKLVYQPLGSSLTTQPGRIMGTPRYMAPEQGAGEEVDHRADLYAVGLLMYEMLAGDYPFQASNMRELLIKLATEAPPPLSDFRTDLPEEVDEFLEVALAKSKDDRFESALEMLAELDALEDLDVSPSGRRIVARTARRKRRRPSSMEREPESQRAWLPWAIGAGLFVLAGGAWWSLSGSGNVEPPVRVSLKAPELRTEEEARYVEILSSAQGLLSGGDPAAALRKIEEARRFESRDSEYYFLRGEIYRADGDQDTARADYEEALLLDAAYVDAVCGLGWIAVEGGDLAEARQRFEHAVTLDEASAEALAGRGAVTLLEAGSGAEGDLRRSVELDADCFAGHYYLGLLLRDRGDLREALDELIEAKRQAPIDWRPLVALGEIYRVEGQPGEAVAQFRAALTLKPGTLPAFEALIAVLLEGQSYREAQEAFDRFGAELPAADSVRILRAIVANQTDSIDKQRASEQALAAASEDAWVQLLMGQFLHRAGDFEGALERYERALQLERRLPKVQKNRGLALFELELYEESAVALAEAVSDDGGDLFAHLALGVLYMQYLGRASDAVFHFEAYRDQGGEDPRVADWLAELGQR